MNTFAEYLRQNRGYEVFGQREREFEERVRNRVRRFYLRPEEEAKIVFVDDDPVIIEEHHLRVQGRWGHFYTCLRIVGQPCPLCDQLQNRPYTVGFYTIIDGRKWIDRTGQEHVNEIKLFPAKFKQLQQLKYLSQKYGGLAGAVFEVKRTTKDAFSTGDTFIYLKRIEKPEQLLKLNPNAKPLDYEQILAPKSAAELSRLLGMVTPADGDDDIDFDDDDINF